MGSDNKKKMSIIGLSSILLVAAVVAAVGISRKNNEGDAPNGEIQSSNKAIQALCSPTDYKEACVESLSGAADSNDPKALIKAGFNVAVKDITDAINNSTTLQEATKDERTSGALKTCKELLNTSIDDLRRSFDKVGNFDIANMDEYISTLKVWLSASLTYQQTCIDGFENTTGEAGEKMKKLLKTAGEITSNGLAMVSEISTIITEMKFSGASRRLFSENEESDLGFDDAVPRYMDPNHPRPRRPSNKEESNLGVDDPAPRWVDPERRSVLVHNVAELKPTVTVAQDGSGQFKTIQEAVNASPKKSKVPYVIHIKEGIYNEYVDVLKHHNNIVFIGDGMDKTKITGNKNFADGVGTYKTATVAVNADNFVARDITFENSAGAVKHQAVALRVSGDMAIFYKCRMDAYQDTLYTHSYRQYYRECTISGTIDYIFGDAAALFQSCKMIVRKPGPGQNCMVTAQGRKDHRGVGGIVLQNCHITSEPELNSDPQVKSYLGRPWKEYSRTVIMQSEIDGFIDPTGWSIWMGNFGLDTSYYAEYNNRGPGADLAKRVTWNAIKKISPPEAEFFTGGTFLQGDSWIKDSGIPYEPGMMKV